MEVRGRDRENWEKGKWDRAEEAAEADTGRRTRNIIKQISFICIVLAYK